MPKPFPEAQSAASQQNARLEKSSRRGVGFHTCVEFFHTRAVAELRGGAKVAKYPQKKLSVRQNRRRRKRCPAARRRPLGRHRRQPLPGSTQRSARAPSPAHLPGLHAAASGQHRRQPFRAAPNAPLGLHRRHTSRGCTPPPPRAAARQPTRPWRGGSRRPCSSRRA